jgi:hypothetical protein
MAEERGFGYPRSMRRIPSAALLMLLGAGCSPASPRAIVFPHEAARVGDVCEGATAPSGLAISVEAPFQNTGLRRFRITNVASAPREIRLDFMVQNAGLCDSGWARSTRLELEDNATCEPTGATSLAPNASIEIRIPPRRVELLGECTKIGLALWSHVDGERACLELGSWIAQRPAQD